LKPLTRQQTRMMDYLVTRFVEHLQAPTLREIGEHMGVTSTNATNDMLKCLERKGYIRRPQAGVSRGIQITPGARLHYGLFFGASKAARDLAELVHFMTQDAGPSDRLVVEPQTVQLLRARAVLILEGKNAEEA